MERIIFFEVNNLNGFISTELKFDRNPTILYGLNGSGKTSVLKLISNLANGNIGELLSTQFRFARLLGLKRKSKKISLEARNEDSMFSFTVIDSDEKYSYKCNRERLSSEDFEHIDDEFNISEAGRYLRKLDSPVFLDINRTFLDDKYVSSDRLLEEHMLRNLHTIKRRFSIQSRFEAMEQLKRDQGLMLAISLIEDELYRVSREESRINSDFRNSVLTESLKTTSIEPFNGSINFHYTDESQLDIQEKSVMKMLNKLDQNDLKDHAAELFNGARSLLAKKAKFDSRVNNEDADPSLLLEIVINKSKLDYLETISEIAQRYSDEFEKEHRKINLFLDLTNRFFRMINKEVVVSGRTIRINGKAKEFRIDCLSSGERQIVIMMAHLLFNPKISSRSVFMLDEPELSLHIAWQDILLQTIMESNPDLQLIVATHAPSVIGAMGDSCLLINE